MLISIEYQGSKMKKEEKYIEGYNKYTCIIILFNFPYELLI